MKKSLVLVALLMVGCKDLSGKLSVNRTFTLNEGQGRRVTPLVLNAGEFDLTVNMKKSDEVTMTVDDGKKHSIIFKTATGGIPAEGAFSIPSSVSGQPVDVKGFITVTVNQSEPIRELEPCRRIVHQRICEPVGRTIRCRTTTDFVPGRHEVEYINITTTHDLNASIYDEPTMSSPAANGHGSRVDFEKRYLYEGICL